MDWKDRIVVDPKVLVGKPVVKGTRISVELVIECLANGWTIDEILEDFPTLKREDVFVCLAYAAATLRDITDMPSLAS